MLTKKEIESREKLAKTKPLVYKKVLNFEEKYKRGESIAIIQLHYNYKCNMKCSHCSISTLKRSKRSLTIEDVKRLFEEADQLGLAHVDITGGEPTLFKDMDQLVEAINPEKFYIQSDTNGWLMTPELARHYKEIGIDKIQLSLDSLDEKEHDKFRNKKGSWKRAVTSIDYILDAGLKLQVATVVPHSRIRTIEFQDFLDFMKKKGVSVSVCFPKPVGEWENKFDELITEEDLLYMDNLRQVYNIYNHLTPMYGMDIGCVAVKRMISITAYGDVMPCPWMYFKLGNIFEDSLDNILKKGMSYFKEKKNTCPMSCDKNFIEKYVKKTYINKDVPVPIEDIMNE